MLLSEFLEAAQEQIDKYGDGRVTLRLIWNDRPIVRIALDVGEFGTVVDKESETAIEYLLDIPITQRIKEMVSK